MPSGFAIVFADGGQHVVIEGRDPVDGPLPEGMLTTEEALELAKEIANALMAAWGVPLRSRAA